MHAFSPIPVGEAAVGWFIWRAVSANLSLPLAPVLKDGNRSNSSFGSGGLMTLLEFVGFIVCIIT